MKIYNTNTNETAEIIYAPTGCDSMTDLTSDAGDITYNKIEERYEATSEAISWWTAHVTRLEQADAYVAAAKDILRYECDVDEAINDAVTGCEFNAAPAITIRCVEDLAREHGYTIQILP